jgi:hypothetical protein
MRQSRLQGFLYTLIRRLFLQIFVPEIRRSLAGKHGRESGELHVGSRRRVGQPLSSTHIPDGRLTLSSKSHTVVPTHPLTFTHALTLS